MIDAILHLCGLCHDAHAHLDLLDLLAGGAASSWLTASCYFRAVRGRKRRTT